MLKYFLLQSHVLHPEGEGVRTLNYVTCFFVIFNLIVSNRNWLHFKSLELIPNKKFVHKKTKCSYAFVLRVILYFTVAYPRGKTNMVFVNPNLFHKNLLLYYGVNILKNSIIKMVSNETNIVRIIFKGLAPGLWEKVFEKYLSQHKNRLDWLLLCLERLW